MIKSPVGVFANRDDISFITKDLALAGYDLKILNKNSNPINSGSVFLDTFNPLFLDNNPVLLPHAKIEIEDIEKHYSKIYLWPQLLLKKVDGFLQNTKDIFQIRIKRLVKPRVKNNNYSSYFLQDLLFLMSLLKKEPADFRLTKNKYYGDSNYCYHINFKLNGINVILEYDISFQNNYFIEVKSSEKMLKYSYIKNKWQQIDFLKSKAVVLEPMHLKFLSFDIIDILCKGEVYSFKKKEVQKAKAALETLYV